MMVRRRLINRVQKRERQQTAALDGQGARALKVEPYRPPQCQVKSEGCMKQAQTCISIGKKLVDACWPCAVLSNPPTIGGWTKEELIEEGRRIQGGTGRARRAPKVTPEAVEQSEATE